MPKSHATILSAALLLSLSGSAWAQTGDLQDLLPEDCEVTPGDDSAEAVPESGASPSDPDALTEKLARCGGVLEPPPTGDPEIVQPPPAIGETPVIPPGALPEQQPPQE